MYSNLQLTIKINYTVFYVYYVYTTQELIGLYLKFIKVYYESNIDKNCFSLVQFEYSLGSNVRVL